MFLIRGEISFSGTWEAVPNTSFFSPKVQLGRQMSRCQSKSMMFPTERKTTCHSQLRPLPARGSGQGGPFQCPLWQSDDQHTPLLEFPGGLTSPVSVFRLPSLTLYLIGICTLTAVRQSAGRKRLCRNLRLPSAWCLGLCSFQQTAGCPSHRLDDRLIIY